MYLHWKKLYINLFIVNFGFSKYFDNATVGINLNGLPCFYNFGFVHL